MSYKAFDYGYEQCKECGTKFQKRAPHQKFCSPLCHGRWWDKHKRGMEQKKEQKQCDMCGTWFTPYQQRQLRCSPHCMRDARNITLKRYKREKKGQDTQDLEQSQPRYISTAFPEGEHLWIAGAEEEAQGLVNPAI